MKLKKMVLLTTISIMLMFMCVSCVSTIPCAAYADKTKLEVNNKG